MKIRKSEIPQANTLEEVLTAVQAVNQGAKSFQDIAQSIHMTGRQGRYYRLAAEILGFLHNEQNNSELTNLGKKLMQNGGQKRKEILRSAVLSAHVFQRMIPFFEIHSDGTTRNQIENFIEQVTEPTTEKMIHRRTSTIISWLEKVDILKNEDGIYKISSRQISATPILNFPDDEPLLPKSTGLTDYKTVQERAVRAGAMIQFMRDQAAHDRANAIHRSLINLVADRLRNTGSIPKSNRIVDLAAFAGNQSILFEMKSTNNVNFRSQIRDGLSQLYEYRYLQNLPDAKLVLVISNPLLKRNSWLQEYLEKDRGIGFIWDGNKQLFASEKTKKELSFLWQ